MKIAATITTCHQIGIETWVDAHTSKIFEETCTIAEIMIWAKSMDKTINFSQIQFSIVVE